MGSLYALNFPRVKVPQERERKAPGERLTHCSAQTPTRGDASDLVMAWRRRRVMSPASPASVTRAVMTRSPANVNGRLPDFVPRGIQGGRSVHLPRGPMGPQTPFPTPLPPMHGRAPIPSSAPRLTVRAQRTRGRQAEEPSECPARARGAKKCDGWTAGGETTHRGGGDSWLSARHAAPAANTDSVLSGVRTASASPVGSPVTDSTLSQTRPQRDR